MAKTQHAVVFAGTEFEWRGITAVVDSGETQGVLPTDEDGASELTIRNGAVVEAILAS